MTQQVEAGASNTDWLRDAGWGVMCHYLASPPADAAKTYLTAEAWNRRVDAFDVAGLAEQLRSTGAGYFMITLGQNSGCYCAPNPTYDSIVGHEPSKCSRRDLVRELGAALTPSGMRMMVYLPSGAPYYDEVARKALEWEDSWIVTVPQEYPVRQTGKRLAEFQLKWERVIRDWSLRWGKLVSGWWIDGVYFADAMYRHPDAPNFQSFAAALKAGNPEAVVAFNPGIFTPIVCHAEHEDYTAGEIGEALPVTGYGGVVPDRSGRWVERNGHKAQYHVLSYLGETWGKGQPRFPAELVVGYTKHVIGREGAITWDVPLAAGGLIPDAFFDQLTRLKHCAH